MAWGNENGHSSQPLLKKGCSEWCLHSNSDVYLSWDNQLFSLSNCSHSHSPVQFQQASHDVDLVGDINELFGQGWAVLPWARGRAKGRLKGGRTGKSLSTLTLLSACLTLCVELLTCFPSVTTFLMLTHLVAWFFSPSLVIFHV